MLLLPDSSVSARALTVSVRLCSGSIGAWIKNIGEEQEDVPM